MKKNVPRGTYDYVGSDGGILVVRWKDNKTVTLLSTDIGVEPKSSVMRYCHETERKESVSCPAVIKSYNANMGGIDKNMLFYLYRTPMKSKRWYLPYTIDLSLSNACIVYKRDCKALDMNAMSLKDLRINMFMSAISLRSIYPGEAHHVLLTTNYYIPPPVRVHHSNTQIMQCDLICPSSMSLSMPNARPASFAANKETS
ncbi:piggyBac transposable element-derived protein 3-like [Cyprinodon tularosa]|uniref:piggyBac transposable element-derived protein 3-like n=1 Tax=Cyprinodon tularosa TaxID=77115 RepID=UPI0018E2710D|nr:piggyBac transposable element-derived protein 3-like [Cyprinodon tularosa]